jgi:hypothetical protein
VATDFDSPEIIRGHFRSTETPYERAQHQCNVLRGFCDFSPNAGVPPGLQPLDGRVCRGCGRMVVWEHALATLPPSMQRVYETLITEGWVHHLPSALQGA